MSRCSAAYSGSSLTAVAWHPFHSNDAIAHTIHHFCLQARAGLEQHVAINDTAFRVRAGRPVTVLSRCFLLANARMSRLNERKRLHELSPMEAAPHNFEFETILANILDALIPLEFETFVVGFKRGSDYDRAEHEAKFRELKVKLGLAIEKHFVGARVDFHHPQAVSYTHLTLTTTPYV